MPESKIRNKHPHHHTSFPPAGPKPKRSAALIVAILAAILGFIAVYFTRGLDTTWLVIGTAIGAVLGFIVGSIMDKSLEKK